MKKTAYVQITPSYPPVIGGVADYAKVIGRHFHDLGIDFGVVSAEVGLNQPEPHVFRIKEKKGAALAALISDADTILLHFSGYGYAARGLCRWLVAGLDQWKRADRSRRLVTLFHEVYATGPVWRSSFWTAPAQRRIARDLACMSESVFVTSVEGYRKIQTFGSKSAVEILPVFSNVGEPNRVSPYQARPRVATVFGGGATRRIFYDKCRRFSADITADLDHAEVDCIQDVGPSGIDVPATLFGRPVKKLGALPVRQLTQALMDSRIGLIHYEADAITKSGTYAAYCAHGVIAINSAIKAPPDVYKAGFAFAPGTLAKADNLAGWPSIIHRNYGARDGNSTALRLAQALANDANLF